jgi:hypothetical protein
MLHGSLALLMQAAIGLSTGNWWAGAALGVGLFIGREHAQAEYRWIERYGLGIRANMPWHGGLQGRVWNIKSLLDMIIPTALTIIVAVMVV